MFVLLNTIVILFLVMVGVIGAGTSGEESALLVIAIVLGVLWALGTVIPGLAVQVRRFHDQDKSGWFVLLGFIPYLGGLIVLVFMLFEGTAGANRFGPDPKDRMEGQLGLSG
jgi:uncharacterized membrane protein YhaH (DUF805 family)